MSRNDRAGTGRGRRPSRARRQPLRARSCPLEDQVVGQGEPVALLDRLDLVPAVGIEGDEGELPAGAAVDDLLALVLDDQGAALERGRQRHDQGADHGVGLLRILVRQEELARAIDQEGVELGLEPAAVGQPEIGAQLFEHRQERPVPPSAVDLHPAPGNLPGVPDSPVEKRLLPPSIASGPGEPAEILRLSPRDGKAEPSEPLHLQLQVLGRRRPPGGEAPGRADRAEDLADPLKVVGHHSTSPGNSPPIVDSM